MSRAAEKENSLLKALRAGDPAALDRVFCSYEPYLRIVVRRMLAGPLRAKMDSQDIVQSVWADVWERLPQKAWQLDDDRALRAFLVTAVRHRFIDRWRQNRNALAHEQPLSGSSAATVAATAPLPNERLEAHELWEELLDKCPAQHRPILHLRRGGVSLERIATRQGIHKSSVRRILYQLARRVFTGFRPQPLDETRSS